MKKSSLLAIGLALAALVTPAMGCTFSWTHYGPSQTKARIDTAIGSKVNDQYCKQYNKAYEIVIVTDEYQNAQETLVHVVVGIRKRGSESVPTKRRSSYQYVKGNFVIAKKYDLASALSMDILMDVMSDLDSFVN